MWQKCPICNGEGKKINTESTSMYNICSTCNGSGIINQQTGLPPEIHIFDKVKVKQEMDLDKIFPVI